MAMKSDRSTKSKRKKATDYLKLDSGNGAAGVESLCERIEGMNDCVYWQQLFTWSESFNRRRFEFQKCTYIDVI